LHPFRRALGTDRVGRAGSGAVGLVPLVVVLVGGRFGVFTQRGGGAGALDRPRGAGLAFHPVALVLALVVVVAVHDARGGGAAHGGRGGDRLHVIVVRNRLRPTRRAARVRRPHL